MTRDIFWRSFEMQMAFYFDQTRCTGCYACLIACKDWHDVELGPVDYMDVVYIEKGKYPTPYVAYMTTTCFHCAHPACASACPASAITKRVEDGIVVVDRELCLGKDDCSQPCKEACPFGMPRFGDEKNAKMQKCNFCLDRLVEGKDPICVAACLSRCLAAGPLDTLKAEYGDQREAVGFTYSEETKPSVIFKPKRK
ncbi:4Fe-4S dicluster domain-containing protein [Thermodesulfobacteriota bacterium]